MYEVIPLVIFALIFIKRLATGYRALSWPLALRTSGNRSRQNSRRASPCQSVLCKPQQEKQAVKKCSSLCRKPCTKKISPQCSSPDVKSITPQLSPSPSRSPPPTPDETQNGPRCPPICKIPAQKHVSHSSQSSYQDLKECTRPDNCPVDKEKRCAVDRHSCFPRVAPTPSCSSKACIVNLDRIEGCPSSRPTCSPAKSHPNLSCEESRNIAINTSDTFCTCLLVGLCKCDHNATCPTLCVIDPKFSRTSSKVSLCNSKGGNYTCERGTHYMICMCDRKQ